MKMIDPSEMKIETGTTKNNEEEIPSKPGKLTL